jgi:signal transduction histidine kinase
MGDGPFGLSIMERRAHAAGGALAVVSGPGTGTRVSLQVPA